MSADQWNAIGAQLGEIGKFPAALAAYRRGLAFDATRGDIRINAADILRRMHRYGDAMLQAELAQEHGTFNHAKFVEGCIAYDSGDMAKALNYWTPEVCGTAYARFCRSMALLTSCQWKEGFEEQESRLEMSHPMTGSIPLWKGESLEDKTLAVHHEQGYGDSICYSRFLRQLNPKTTIFGVPSPLLRLFQSGFPGVWTASMNEGLPKADYICPLMSLPHHLGVTDIPLTEGYIGSQGGFDIPSVPGTRLKVGIVWTSKSGGPKLRLAEQIHGASKSILLETLLPLATIPGVQLYSLQTGPARNDIEETGSSPFIVDLGKRDNDFCDGAAFAMGMDLIVSVDTAGLHLAGALGKPAIGLINYSGAWPWTHPTTTAWYKSVSLIRQPKPGDWESVVNELAKRLG